MFVPLVQQYQSKEKQFVFAHHRIRLSFHPQTPFRTPIWFFMHRLAQ